jgi:hypothetical protein
VSDGIDRILQAPPAWAIRERDARRDGDQRRPKEPPHEAPRDDEDDGEQHLIDVRA